MQFSVRAQFSMHKAQQLPSPRSAKEHKQKQFVFHRQFFISQPWDSEEPRGSELSVGPEDFGSVWQG